MNGALVADPLRRRQGQSDHSYKFQRLREKIRQAVASGELTGKLPGERSLARRFGVNAKTLSKALTDLAAEGLLSRSIGRGTFVKSTLAEPAVQNPWLVVCEDQGAHAPLLAALRLNNPQLEVVGNVTALRPSFLNQFSAVVDLGYGTPQTFIRDMLVRNMSLVVVGREPVTYSTNATLLDAAYLAARLGRELLLGGHRHLAAVEGLAADFTVTKALRSCACRYAPEAEIVTCKAGEVLGRVEQGVTAVVCGSAGAAGEVTAFLTAASISIPRVASVAAIGMADGDYPASGFYLGAEQAAEAVTHLLQNGRAGGSTVLWLTGKQVDRGTIGPASAHAQAAPPALSLTA